LSRSYQHGLPCHQLPLSSQVSQEDLIWAYHQ
jgi:hypothetical protein